MDKCTRYEGSGRNRGRDLFRVYGHLKSFQGKEQVVVYAIRLVYDCNEIPNHFLECIHTHSRNTRLQDNGSSVSTLTSSVISTSSVHQTASSIVPRIQLGWAGEHRQDGFRLSRTTIFPGAGKGCAPE